MLKFLLDAGVGNKVKTLLDTLGYDTTSILDLDSGMPDSDILLIADRDKRMVITMDKDFGELVYRTGQSHNGVLLLRLEDATGREKAEIVHQILENFADQMEGNFCVFQDGRLRIRK